VTVEEEEEGEGEKKRDVVADDVTISRFRRFV